ncbi:VasL domain-containing protein [Edaphovirga cremea]|uniref:VasL domain-containing protein n=1 Tax=Edaphovirga cremea TaxID=2267246 RepID=UPI003989C120
MSPAYERHLKTGSDPRTIPDYSALRDELGKLSHPARPDVNWRYVEKLALNIFDSNGVDLQTAAWYTLARTQLAGIYGFNEGLAILDALIRYQWSAMWPTSAHARIEIISSLSKRLQQIFRTLTLQRADLVALYQSERLLTTTGEALQRLELHNAAGTDTLRQMLQNSIVRLENSDAPATNAENQSSAVSLPAHVVNPVPEEGSSRWVYVVHSQPTVDVDIKTESPKRVTPARAFLSGLLTATVFGMIGFKVVPELLSHPEEKALMSSVSVLPTTLPVPVTVQLHQRDPAWLQQNDIYGRELNERLEELSKLPPYWPLQYGSQLVEQTRHLYPGSELANNALNSWRSMMLANSLPEASKGGWHQGVTELQKLQERLNQLDEKKGKYLTVSELKTAVFTVSKSLNDSVPAEELIRQLQSHPSDQPLPQALLNQTDLQLRQLVNSYMMIRTNYGKK